LVAKATFRSARMRLRAGRTIDFGEIDRRPSRRQSQKCDGCGAKGVNCMPQPRSDQTTRGGGVGDWLRLSIGRRAGAGLRLVKIACPKLNIRRPFSVLFRQGPIPSGIGQAFMQML
jgi:hypothetical protein